MSETFEVIVHWCDRASLSSNVSFGDSVMRLLQLALVTASNGMYRHGRVIEGVPLDVTMCEREGCYCSRVTLVVSDREDTA